MGEEGEPKKDEGRPAGDPNRSASSEREISAHRLYKNDSIWGDCKPDRLEVLKRLLEAYKPRQRMRKEHRDLVKTIISLKQGFDGDQCRCVVCGQTDRNDVIEIHHFDGVEAHNELVNLGPTHHSCNSALNGRSREAARRALFELSRLGSESEREKFPPTGMRAKASERSITEDARSWSSKEGVKHDTQRYGWNQWITDLEKGPFKGINTQIYKTSLAKMAPWGLGNYLEMDGPLGSSVTYRRFIDEDIAGGILGQSEDKFGKLVVYLNYNPKTEKTT